MLYNNKHRYCSVRNKYNLNFDHEVNKSMMCFKRIERNT